MTSFVQLTRLPRHLQGDGALQRGICLLLLASLSVGFLGFPLRAPSAPKEGRYPCEASACGCHSAERCWDRCCCHSDEEKLRWAAEQGVDPPEFLVQRVAVQNSKMNPATPRSCCTEAVVECSLDEKPSVPDEGMTSPVRLIRLESVAKCQGIELIWTLLSSVIVEPPASAGMGQKPLQIDEWRLSDELADSAILDCDPPVPWSGCC